MVALVGLSGSGRTTITQLLCRLYDPQGGAVYVDDVDVRSLNVGWLRRHFGVVGQNPELFSMTIAENIRLGCDPGTCTQANVERAATEANAHDFIMALPLVSQIATGGSIRCNLVERDTIHRTHAHTVVACAQAIHQLLLTS